MFERFGVSKKPEGYEPLKDEELDDLDVRKWARRTAAAARCVSMDSGMLHPTLHVLN